jgi:formylglycine-generating enzyme required for sulfatase activity
MPSTSNRHPPERHPVLGEHEMHEIARFARALDLTAGFAFHVVVSDTRRVFHAALDELDVQKIRIRPGPAASVGPQEFTSRVMLELWQAIDAAREASPKAAVLLDAVARDPGEDDVWRELFRAMNQARNDLRSRMKSPLVLCLSPRLEGVLGAEAPDFYSIRGSGMRLQDPALFEAALNTVSVGCTASSQLGPFASNLAARPIRWLHLSDLHVGCRGEAAYHQVLAELEPSIKAWTSKLGAPDLVLLSGDLAFRGEAGEFDRVSAFLDRLLGWLRSTDSQSAPLIVPVPGNHDLARPAGRGAFAFRVFDLLERGRDDPDVELLENELWTQRDASFIAPLFENYVAWQRTKILPELAQHARVHASHFPGDLSVEVHPPGAFPLFIVGLNSAWTQYRAGDFEKKLVLSAEQFQAALPPAPEGNSPLDVFGRFEQALLLVHHPPAWLEPHSRKTFYEAIYPPERFRLLLHGHLHEGGAETVALHGGKPRYSFQARSVFGMEDYGTPTETRLMGYAWGSLSRTGEVRVWPLGRVERGGGEHAFDWDQRFGPYDERGVRLREPDPAEAAAAQPPALGAAAIPAAAPVSEPDIDAYRDWLRARYHGIELIGLGGGDVELGFDDVYVPLRISARARADAAGLEFEGKAPLGERWRQRSAEDVELTEVFSLARPSGAQHVILFGEPGAGKTTCLKKLASQCVTQGPESLGLEPGTVPVWLRLRRLDHDDLTGPAGAIIERELKEISERDARTAPSFTLEGLGDRLWQRGRLLLLLDGLDEVASEPLRERICRWLLGLMPELEQRHIHVAVSCRYAGYTDKIQRTELAGRFLSLDLRPLDRRQVAELVRNWFRAATLAFSEYKRAATLERGEGLVKTLDGESYASQRLKVLVSTPLLLSLLCLVVLRGDEMPKRRVTFYEQCLRVLLSQWSQDKKQEPLVDVETALGLLRPIAYKLHAAGRRDDLSTAELVLWLEQGLSRVENAPPAWEVREWLFRVGGILEDYGSERWGFFHLGVQEYLTALHFAAEGEKALGELVGHADDPWWREVFLLLVGLPNTRLFGPLFERLLDRTLSDPTLLGACMEEAAEVDVPALVRWLEQATDPARQATLLRLLRGRKDAELFTAAERLQGSEDDTVRALAELFVRDARGPELPSGARGHDLGVLSSPEHAERALELKGALESRGLRLWPDLLGVEPSWQRRLPEILETVSGLAVVVGPEGPPPWQEPSASALIELMKARERLLVPVLLQGCNAPPGAPQALEGLTWVSLAQGERAAVGQILGRVASRGARAEAALGRFGAVPGREFIEPETGTRLLWIPGARFQMGGTEQYDGKPIHWVRVSDFWLAETPVTNAQYQKFMEATGQGEPPYWRDRRFSEPDQPVVGVTWHDAVKFCEWLTTTSDLAVTLPSEAQWEYAARGTDGRDYPWGKEPPEGRACFGQDYNKGRPAAVGSYPGGKGPFGTLDQAGNVWEWCLDVWDQGAYQKRASREVLDPVVREGEAESRSVRGGSWSAPAGLLRSAIRGRGWADFWYGDLGFRVAAGRPSR